MTRVQVRQGEAGAPPRVTVDGLDIPAVAEVTVQAAPGQLGHVYIRLTAAEVDVELPAAVTVARESSAALFVASLNPAAVERASLEHIDAGTVGEAFLAALTAAADEWDTP